jgi:hypothetical protein
MDSRNGRRYLHIAGAFGVGGRLTKIGDVPIDLPIETVAPAHLPMVGGRSESIGKLIIDGRHIPSGKVSANILDDLKKRELLSVGPDRGISSPGPRRRALGSLLSGERSAGPGQAVCVQNHQ